MSLKQKCPNCQGTNVFHDDKNGDLACEDCGTILDNCAVDESVEFVENTAGGASLVSRYVAHGDENSDDTALRASRAITFKKGGDRIEHICSTLRIDGDRNVVDFAKSIYQDAVEKRLTWGRPARITAAACVYLAARYKNKELMLTDIAEMCQIDVTSVFHVFSDLCYRMDLKVPFHDPCLFVARFAHALKLGQHLSEVIKISSTLVRRMKTDFITLGRYPSGIIAAALIFACRSVGIYKTVDDLVKVVRIHESTIKKRMMEFAQTDAAKLTAEELKKRENNGNSIPAAEAPPCLQRQRAMSKMPAAPAPSKEEMDSLVKEINGRLEKAREKAQRMIMARYMTGDLGNQEEQANTEELISDELNEDLLNEEELGEEAEENEVAVRQKRPQFRPSLEGTGFEEKERDENAPPKYPRLWQWAQDGDKRTFEMNSKDDGTLDLTGINDDELASYLCADDQEVLRRKRLFWNPEYDEFLKERARKKALRLKMTEGSSNKKRRKVTRAKQADMRGNSAAESFAKMVKKTQLVKKIDSEHFSNVMKLLGGCDDLVSSAIEDLPESGDKEVRESPAKRPKKDTTAKAKSETDSRVKIKSETDSKVKKESIAKSEKDSAKGESSTKIETLSKSADVEDSVDPDNFEIDLSGIHVEEIVEDDDYFDGNDEEPDHQEDEDEFYPEDY